MTNSTTVSYSPYCVQNTVTSATGIQTVTNLDALCRPTSIVTQAETTSVSYDSLSRPLTVTSASLYASAGLLNGAIAGTAQTEQTRAYGWDAGSQLQSIQQPNGSSIVYALDKVGNVTLQSDTNGNVTTRTFFPDNQVATVTYSNPSESPRTFAYGYSTGRLSTVTYPTGTGIEAIAAFDKGGRQTMLQYVLSGTGANILSFQYGFDQSGNRTQLIEQNGALVNTTTTGSFSQPAVGSTQNVSVTTNSDMSVGQLLYIASGGLYSVASTSGSTSVTVTNIGAPGNVPSGTTVASTTSAVSSALTYGFGYDWIDRLTSVALNEASLSAYSLDGNDNRIQYTAYLANGSSNVNGYAYNLADQIQSRTSGGSPLEAFVIDADGRMTSRILTSSGQTTIHTWTTFNKLGMFSVSPSPILSTTTGSSFSPPSPNANTGSISFASTVGMVAGQLISIAGAGLYSIYSTSGSNAVLTNLGFVGNATSGTIASGANAAVISTNTTTTTASFTQPTPGTNLTVDLTSTSGMLPGQVVYIASGGFFNVISVLSATQVVLANLGFPGNAPPLTTTISSGSAVSTIAAVSQESDGYSADGLRNTRSDGTQYFTSGGNSLSEIRPSGPVSFIQTGGISGIDPGPTITGAPFFYLTDVIGSVRQTVNASGNTETTSTFNEFGLMTPVWQTSVNLYADKSLAFVGAEGVRNEPNTPANQPSGSPNGLLLMGQRWYDPNLGLFLSPDPIGFAGGLNLFNYASQAPTNYVDPSGRAGYIYVTGQASPIVVNTPQQFLQALAGLQPGSVEEIDIYGHGSATAATFTPTEKVGPDLQLDPSTMYNGRTSTYYLSRALKKGGRLNFGGCYGAKNQGSVAPQFSNLLQSIYVTGTTGQAVMDQLGNRSFVNAVVGQLMTYENGQPLPYPIYSNAQWNQPSPTQGPPRTPDQFPDPSLNR